MKHRGVLHWTILIWIILSAFSVQAGEIERIQAKGEIVVSLNKGYPPFSMEKEGKLSGLDVDLARLLADALGVKVKFIRPEKYEAQIPRLLAGDSDIIIAAMTRTVERGLKVNFTDPYFEVSQAALALRSKIAPDADSYFDLTTVQNLKLGVKADTTHEAFARQLFPADSIRTYPTAAAAADALVKGEVDAMTADSPFISVWRATHPALHPKIKALLAPVTREHYGFAIRKGDLEFLNWLNLFIDQIKTDGTLDLLNYEYFIQMNWAKPSGSGPSMTPAEMLKNQFIRKKKEMLEQQRNRDALLKGDAYE